MQGGFIGAFSLLKEMTEVKQYMEAVEAVFAEMPSHPSIVCSSIVSAIEGHYGDYHKTARTKNSGSALWINPMMTLYWCFRLSPVARRILYLDRIKQSQTIWHVLKAIECYRDENIQRRKRTPIPDVSLGSTLTW
jgi:hypothetical protein